MNSAGTLRSGEVISKRMILATLANTLDTAIEWYDFLLYGTMATLVFPALFFPDSDQFVGTLLALLTSNIGFISRPFGGPVFGHLSDCIGRKSTLVACPAYPHRPACSSANPGDATLCAGPGATKARGIRASCRSTPAQHIENPPQYKRPLYRTNAVLPLQRLCHHVWCGDPPRRTFTGGLAPIIALLLLSKKSILRLWGCPGLLSNLGAGPGRRW